MKLKAKIARFQKAGIYLIEVEGNLDDRWSERLAGMRISTYRSKSETSVTRLVGHLRDQAQLSGVLNSLYELHLPILLVEYREAEDGAGKGSH
jgi:hypothetical protein